MGLYADELLHGTPAGRSIEDGAPPARSPADWGRQRSPQMDRSLSPPPARRPAYSPRAQEVRGNDGGRGEAREATFYVGGLSYSATADKVRSAFSRLGPIREFKLIIDRETSQSKGFGFLTFESEVYVEDVMQMNGHLLEGRPLKVNLPTNKGDSAGRGRGRGDGGYGGHGGGFDARGRYGGDAGPPHSGSYGERPFRSNDRYGGNRRSWSRSRSPPVRAGRSPPARAGRSWSRSPPPPPPPPRRSRSPEMPRARPNGNTYPDRSPFVATPNAATATVSSVPMDLLTRRVTALEQQLAASKANEATATARIETMTQQLRGLTDVTIEQRTTLRTLAQTAATMLQAKEAMQGAEAKLMSMLSTLNTPLEAEANLPMSPAREPAEPATIAPTEPALIASAMPLQQASQQGGWVSEREGTPPVEVGGMKREATPPVEVFR